MVGVGVFVGVFVGVVCTVFVGVGVMVGVSFGVKGIVLVGVGVMVGVGVGIIVEQFMNCCKIPKVLILTVYITLVLVSPFQTNLNHFPSPLNGTSRSWSLYIGIPTSNCLYM